LIFVPLIVRSVNTSSFSYAKLLHIGTCPPLTAPDDGTIDCSLGDDDEATNLDYCTFKCNDGFKIKRGTNRWRKCIASKSRAFWTGRITICEGRLYYVQNKISVGLGFSAKTDSKLRGIFLCFCTFYQLFFVKHLCIDF